MIKPYKTVEEAKIGLLEYLRELAQHPAINVEPHRINIDTSPRYRRRHACCKTNYTRQGKTWTIIFNLPVLKANLENVPELEHICQHEIAHVAAPNHGPQFRKVCRALGIPEDRIGAKTSQLKNAIHEEVFVCLRCGTKKKTLRAHTTRMKRCDWCGLSWDHGLNRMDKAKTMAMFPIKEAGSIAELAVPGRDRHERTRWLPWREYAKYLRDGGEMTALGWWMACLENGIYKIPAKYQGTPLAPDFSTYSAEATAIKGKKPQ